MDELQGTISLTGAQRSHRFPFIIFGFAHEHLLVILSC